MVVGRCSETLIRRWTLRKEFNISFTDDGIGRKKKEDSQTQESVKELSVIVVMTTWRFLRFNH